jgi:TatD DNase family protein
MAFYNVHTHQSRSHEVAIVQAVDAPLNQFHSSGIHPWFADSALLSSLEMALEHPACKALGEVGLDRLKGPSMEIQRSVLEKQLCLAAKHHKPVIFHIVQAWGAFYALQKAHQVTPWILHGFNQPKQFPRLLDTQIYLSIGPPALANPAMHSLLAKIPLERLLFETDDSDEEIQWVYQRFCTLAGFDLVALSQRIEQNFLAIFGV